jgi:hypothetical protein
MNRKSLVLSLAFFASPLMIFGGRSLFNLPMQLEGLGLVDYLTICLFWIAAILLLTKMRFAWAFSAFLTVIAAGLNGAQMIRTFSEMGSVLPTVQFIFCVGLMCALFMLMNYLDKSLFDRRDNFSVFGVADRKLIQTNLILQNDKAPDMTGTICSLSRSGFMAEVSGFGSTIYLMDWKASLPEFNFHNLPVQLVEIEGGKKIRAQFSGLDFFTQLKLHRKLKSL